MQTFPTSQAASTGSRCNPRDRKQKDGTIKKRQWNEERAPIMLRTLNQLRDRRECISHKACLCQPFPTAHALLGLCRPSKLSSGMLIADWQQVLSLSGIFKLNGGPAQTYIICWKLISRKSTEQRTNSSTFRGNLLACLPVWWPQNQHIIFKLNVATS